MASEKHFIQIKTSKIKIFLIIIVVILFIFIEHLVYLSNIGNKITENFAVAMYESDIEYIDQLFDTNTLFYYNGNILSYIDARENIINSFNDKHLHYSKDGYRANKSKIDGNFFIINIV